MGGIYAGYKWLAIIMHGASKLACLWRPELPGSGHLDRRFPSLAERLLRPRVRRVTVWLRKIDRDHGFLTYVQKIKRTQLD